MRVDWNVRRNWTDETVFKRIRSNLKSTAVVIERVLVRINRICLHQVQDAWVKKASYALERIIVDSRSTPDIEEYLHEAFYSRTVNHFIILESCWACQPSHYNRHFCFQSSYLLRNKVFLHLSSWLVELVVRVVEARSIRKFYIREIRFRYLNAALIILQVEKSCSVLL